MPVSPDFSSAGQSFPSKERGASRATQKFWRRSFGVRARLFFVFATACLVTAFVQVTVFRPLVVATIEAESGQAALLAAKVMKAHAPSEPQNWPKWVEDLSTVFPGLRPSLVTGVPGSPQFQEACSRLGLDGQVALSALVEGEKIARSHDGRMVGLVRLRPKEGPLALLCVEAQNVAIGGHIWALWLWSLLLSFMLAGAVAYVLAYKLIVRPVRQAVGVMRRLENASSEQFGSDISSLSAVVSGLEKALKESNRKAERLSYELRRMREDLKGAQATLIRTEKLACVGQLAAGIAHEIGNPIGIILGLSELLSNGTVEGEEARRFAMQISESATRVHGIIKDLLQFARPSKDEHATANVRDVIGATLQLLRPQKRFKQVEVLLDMEGGPLFAEIRASQLQQVLVNLLLNAADAMKGRGKVTVRAYRQDRAIFIEVEDEGPGIPAEERERIFDPFYTTKAPGEGTGLGLPISAQIVQVYGGEITVKDARSGRGACFVVRLWQPGEIS